MKRSVGLILGVLLFALTGCFRSLDTSPLQPTAVSSGGGIAALPSNTPGVAATPTIEVTATNVPTQVVTVPPSETPVNVGAVPTQPETPTESMLPTETQIAIAPPTETSVPTEVAVIPPTETPFPTEVVAVNNTEIPSETPPPTEIIPPTETPVPTDVIPPTETPFATEVGATETVAETPTVVLPEFTEIPTETPTPAGTTVALAGSTTPTGTSTPDLMATYAPVADGARGMIDADCNYHVASADRLIRIALRFKKTLPQLMTANNLLSADLIRTDQIIKIPDCQLLIPTATFTPTTSATPTGTPTATTP